MDPDTATRTLLLRCLRRPGRARLHAAAQRWRTLTHLTARPHRIGPIAQTALVPTHVQHGYLNP